MVFPKQTLTVLDPGIPLAAVGGIPPLMTGCAWGGSTPVNTVSQINDISQVRALIGYGPLAEDIALALQVAGGPINFIIHNVTGSALTSQAMTHVGTGSVVATLSGTPKDRYGVMVSVIAGGTVGTATFQFSLDNWVADAPNVPATQSNTYLTAATFVIPNSGLTINFATGTYVAGDTFYFATTPGEPGTTDLGGVNTAIVADTSLAVDLWQVSGAQATYTGGGAIAAAFEGYLAGLTQGYRYARGLIDVGSGDTEANVHTEASAWTGVRVLPCYGYELATSALPFEGYSTRKTSCVSSIGARAQAEEISSDLSRTAAGACSEALFIYFDGFLNQQLDADQISTMRTWTGKAGFWIAGGKLKCSFGSDFTDLQFGRVMDTACLTTYNGQFPLQSAIFRATSTGTIDPRDASYAERGVQGQLDDALLSPINSAGTSGHVSAVAYSISLSNNIVETMQLVSSVAIVPLGYAKLISTTLAYQLSNVGA
jgi:hypothetical protein